MTAQSLAGLRGVDGVRARIDLEPVELSEAADALGFASAVGASLRGYARADERYAHATREVAAFRGGHESFLAFRGAEFFRAAAPRPAPRPLVYREPRSQLLRQPRPEIIVRFGRHVRGSHIDRILGQYGMRRSAWSPFVPNQVVASGGALDDLIENAFFVAAELSEQEEVVFATPSFFSQYRRTAPAVGPLQWHLDNRGTNPGQKTGEDVRALPAWATALGAGTMVAVLDDGVDVEHPALIDRVWMDPDDPRRRGRDFFVDAADPGHCDPRPKTWNHPFDDRDTNDIHGTPCAGLIAANGTRGVAGVAPECTLLPVKIFHASRPALDERIADAIRFAGLQGGADVISCSWEGGSHPDVEQAILDVLELGRGGNGCVVVCSAGNQYRGPVAFPAYVPGVIAVGASTDQGDVAPYSNRGADLAIVAPSDGGVLSVFTADVSIPGRGYNPNGVTTDRFGGTSAATAMVAGAAALLLAARPTLRADEVREILMESADRIGALPYADGRNDVFGAGRVNLERAFQRIHQRP